jgi:hypothetical protein
MNITRLPSEKRRGEERSGEERSGEEKAAFLRVADSDQRTMIRQHAKMVLQALKGKSYRNIAEEVCYDKDTVSAIVQEWLKNGIGAIVTWGGHERPPG